MWNLLVRLCSRTNCLMRNFESKSREWTERWISCSIQIDMSVTNHAQIFERVCVGELS